LTTFEVAISDISFLSQFRWQAIVVDEGHRLKGAASKLKAALKVTVFVSVACYRLNIMVSLWLTQRLRCEFRLLLSGTPLQNNIQELWALLNFLEPTKFAEYDQFRLKYGSLESAQQIEELQRTITPHLLRRVKEQVEQSIPKKEETIIDVELTVLQKQYYRAIFERNRLFLYRGCDKSNLPGLVNIEMQLRKTCNHPYLINGVAEKDALNAPEQSPVDRLVLSCGKFVLLDKLLPKLKMEGHRVLIFRCVDHVDGLSSGLLSLCVCDCVCVCLHISQMVRMLDLLEEYLRLKDYGYERLDGKIRGVERQAAIDRYCAPGSSSFVFLLSTRAGGLGINLTVADTVPSSKFACFRCFVLDWFCV
jgi:SNF2 family DNA or RNA helicase